MKNQDQSKLINCLEAAKANLSDAAQLFNDHPDKGNSIQNIDDALTMVESALEQIYEFGTPQP